ncbi:uncharacterized protein KGF55_004667 [Candida pseudojiufengensis]|uniref:uncharacterized protein n=1 Tax=Candida pseudojiufengensis TaxID=497109 RepID=UPI002224AC91|nr:uncharacterized protein KGF55_004667 [Candida pseudojiufengensis]KAI5960375.1 hypothetical protein KGF55_004667 [Candida pseudojiufengensis]
MTEQSQFQSNSTMSIKLDTNDIQDKIKNVIPYPEPIKSKFPFKQQPFALRKIQKLSIFPSKEQKNENKSQKNSNKLSIRLNYFLNKSWILIKECSTIIFYDFIIILYTIFEILITIGIFIFFTFRGLYFIIKEILYYLTIYWILPILIACGMVFGLIFGLFQTFKYVCPEA